MHLKSGNNAYLQAQTINVKRQTLSRQNKKKNQLKNEQTISQ